MTKVISEETRENMRKAALGHKVSPETRAKISASLMGNIPWNKGKPYQIGQGKYQRTKEHKKILRELRLGKSSWNKGITGPNSHSWEGGKSALSDRIRISFQYKQWRAEVFRRDGWTCQTCGLRGHGKDIEAHHIKPMKELLEVVYIKGVNDEDKYLLAMQIPEMFSVSNGITLCKPCHILTFKGEKK